MAHTQYGIGVTKNRFELFDDEDEDPLEVLKVREQEKEARKKTKLSEKENKIKDSVPKVKQTVQRKGIKETQNIKNQDQNSKLREGTKRFENRIERPDRRFQPEQREERVYNRHNRTERSGERSREERYEKREPRGEVRGYIANDGGDSRGRGRGGNGPNRGAAVGRGRGGRSMRPGFYDNRGKREFERQSGSDKTGVKPVDKREGSGAHNWGSHRDDLDDIVQGTRSNGEEPPWASEKTDESITEVNINVTDENPPENGTGTEEEPKELTLDEWRALKGPRQKPVYNLRKAGEGEDLSQWKKMYALQKKKEGDFEEDEDEEEYESCEYPQRVGRQKHILDIDIHFKDARVRGRGGRGGRGGPRLNIRVPLQQAPAEKNVKEEDFKKNDLPKVDDEHDFPSLIN